MTKRLSITPMPLSSWASRRIYATCLHQQTPGSFWRGTASAAPPSR